MVMGVRFVGQSDVTVKSAVYMLLALPDLVRERAADGRSRKSRLLP
jgi:hypothetical protein